jgi:hypothetical protein
VNSVEVRRDRKDSFGSAGRPSFQFLSSFWWSNTNGSDKSKQRSRRCSTFISPSATSTGGFACFAIFFFCFEGQSSKIMFVCASAFEFLKKLVDS